jgi:bifunctional DNase/RNase
MDPEQEYISANVERVSLSKMGFVVFLKLVGNDKVIPIFIGASEAHSISSILNQQRVPRPLTHDLFKNVLEIMGGDLLMVHITSVAADTFYATVTIKTGERIIEIDSRPSDALGLALRFVAPIYIHKNVIQSSAVNRDPHFGIQSGKQELSQLETYQGALKKAIEDERYEDAGKLKEQILKIQNITKHQ